jgi:hypothetical protein
MTRFNSQLDGWVFPADVADSDLPDIQIGLGDPNSSGGEQLFSISPEDLAFSEASSG